MAKNHYRPPSPREMQVIRLVAQGLTDGEIAAALSLSPYTVRNHLSHVFSKLGVKNRVEAALYVDRLDRKK